MILFSIIIWLLYLQFEKINADDWAKVSIKRPVLVVCSFLLVVLNWYLEYIKWGLVIDAVVVQPNKNQKVKSFFAGIVTGLITPNMLGNFIGRMYYFARRDRVGIVMLTLLGNLSQFIASILFGAIAVLVLGELPFEFDSTVTSWVLLFFIMLLIILYFRFESVKIALFQRVRIYQKMCILISRNPFFRLKSLFYSMLRNLVFTFQFWLLLNSFVDASHFDYFLWIWQVFLWSTLIPTLWFGKLIVRETVALIVFTRLGFAAPEILITSVCLWIINLAFPALLSIFICKRRIAND